MTIQGIIDDLNKKIEQLNKIQPLPATPEYRLLKELEKAVDNYETNYTKTHRVWFGA